MCLCLDVLHRGKIATCGNDCDLRILSITDDSYYKEFGIESDYSHCLATWNCSEVSWTYMLEDINT